MLGYQLARGSVSMERFNLYLDEICGVGTYHFLPVIRASELRSLAKMKAKTFVIKVADPHDLEAVEDDHKTLKESIIHLKENMDGAYIRVTVGMGRRKGYLDDGPLRSTISWLLEQRARKRGKVQSMQVKGRNMDDTEANPLNFLKAHVGAEEVIDLDGLGPTDNFNARAGFMRRAIATNVTELAAFAKIKL
jgi:hypothetical protein